MAFDLLTLLAKLFGGIDTDSLQAKADAWIAENRTKYPDADALLAAMNDFLTAELTAAKPELDPEKIKNTIYGAAKDILAGSAGVDPNAPHGMV